MANEDQPMPYLRLYSCASKVDILVLTFGMIASIVHGAVNPFVIYLFGRMNDAYGDSGKDPAKAFDSFFKLILIIMYVGAGSIVVTAIESTCWTLVGENVTSRIKKMYLRSLLSQEVGYYDMETSTGEIINAVSSDTILVHDAVGEKVGAFIYCVSIFVTGLILSTVIFWKMAFVGLTAVPLLLGVGGVYITLYTKFSMQAAAAYKNADLVTEQALSQVKTIYSFVGETKMLERISKSLQNAVQLSIKTGLSKGMGLGITMATAYLSWALLFWYGGFAVRKHQLKGGTALALVLISLYHGRAVGECLRLLESIMKGKAAAGRLFQVIDRQPTIDSNEGEQLEKLDGRIEFYQVSFAYPSRPDVPIFKDFSLKIPQGRIMAVVGPSGSGKSSIISLINRFYDPQDGELRIDGRNIKEINLKWLRTQIGLVSQEPALFAASIKENILLAKPRSSHEQVIKASRMANAHDFISELPDGYHTQVGSKGMQLSGGQKQRIAIARATLKHPTILLLDEATSALDSESEMLVQKALDNIMQQKTTVVVAHRLSTIRNADTIVVVDKGQIVESGTHNDLVSLENGTYAALVRLQNIKQPERSLPSSAKSSPAHDYIQSLSPSTSRRRSSRRSSRSFSFSLVQSPAHEPPSKEDIVQRRAVLQWFGKVLWSAWSVTIAAGLGALLAGAVTGTFPLLMAKVVVLFLGRQVNEANKWILGIACLSGAALTGNMVQYFFGHRAGAKTSKVIQEMSLQGIMRNEVGWFDDEENSGSAITARISTNATNVRNASDTLSFFLHNLVAITLATALAFKIQWQIALLALANTPLQVIGSSLARGFSNGSKMSGNVEKSHEMATRTAGEAVSSIRTVYSLGAEEHMLALFGKQLLTTKFKMLRRVMFLGTAFGVISNISVFANALGLWYGLSLVKSGHASFGDVLMSYSILSYGTITCEELVRMIPDFMKGMSSLSVMFQAATRKTLIDPESPSGMKLETVTGLIQLENLTFAYPTRLDHRVLARVNLTIKPSTTVALVGPSGSGKSSIVALIQRFYDPILGRILIDGCDLRNLDLRWLRRRIGYVQQEPTLFAGSIRENIAFGKDDAQEDQIVEAARHANAHEFICGLPNGYDTQVGEMGTQLSGGQKQRIAIARAIVKRPAILLLDEATSSLDSESEKAVQAALDGIVRMNEMTTVVVAHRLSTIQHSDEIIVLENGVVKECGRHEQLIASGKTYTKLVKMQQQHHSRPL